MPSADADRNLLFGVLALQADAITRSQFVDACALWASQKEQPLADLLVGRGWLAPADRDDVERLVERKLRKHRGDARAGLAEATGDDIRQSLAAIEDPEARRSLGLSDSPAGHVLVSTIAYRPGSRDRYTLTRLHAQGGIGRVWLARDEALGREVALKELRPEQSGRAAIWARFFEEARITGQLEHPNIVPVHELAGSGEGDDRAPFYTMRFVRGRTLSEASRAYHTRLHEGGAGPLELRDLLLAFVGVCHALAYAHSRGVIHRDLKGQNVVLGDFGEVIVLDWGLAKVVGQADETLTPPVALEHSEGRGETVQGQAMGTPAYMSPEQAVGLWDRVDARTDVYGLGAILYEVLAGQPPFDGADTAEVLRRVATEPPARPRSICDAVPPALEAVCLKALAKKPEDRYPTVEALADEVKHWMADEPVSAYRERLATRAGRWARRHRPLVAGAAALLVTAVVTLSISTVLVNRERAKAEQSFRQARQAVDDYFTTVSESKLLNVPGLQPLRKDLLDRALRYYQGFLRERGGDRSVQAELAATYYRVAWIGSIVGTKDEALGAYRRALAMYEGLARERPAEVRHQTDLAIVCNDLGNLLRVFGRREEALAAHRRGIAVRERLAHAHPGVARYRNELAKGFANTGSVLLDLAQPGEALARLEKARALNEAIFSARTSDLAMPTDLGRSFNTLAAVGDDLAKDNINIGTALAQLGRPADALAAYERGAAVAAQVVAEAPGVSEHRATLVLLETRLGQAHQYAGRPGEARRRLGMARDLAEDLVRRNPIVPFYQTQLAELESMLGNLDRTTGRRAEGLVHMERARSLWEDLATREPSVAGYRGALAGIESQIGFLLKIDGRLDEALRRFERARDLMEEVVRREPTVPGYRSQLAQCGMYTVSALTGAGRHAEALPVLREVVSVYEALADAHPTVPAYRKSLATSLLYYGRFPAGVVPPAEAMAALRRADALLTGAPDLAPVDHYNLACIRALAVELAGREAPVERDRSGALAVESLRRAVAMGYDDVIHFESDSDLKPIRVRDDYKALMAEMKARITAKDPRAGPVSRGTSATAAVPKAASSGP